MSEMSPHILERYQALYQKDPRSKIFAPLAEAYRRTGFQEKAIEICTEGLKNHPYFAEGYVALAKVYFDQEDFKKAAFFFYKATELSPDNLQAHRLLAQCYLNLKSPKKALMSYKMLLFLNPQDVHAKRAVKKLESLTADEYKEDLFFTLEFLTDDQKRDSIELEQSSYRSPLLPHRELDRFLSLADALIVRGDLKRAEEVLNEAERVVGPTSEIEDRVRLIQEGEDLGNTETVREIELEGSFFSSEIKDDKIVERDEKIKTLKTLLSRIKERMRT